MSGMHQTRNSWNFANAISRRKDRDFKDKALMTTLYEEYRKQSSKDPMGYQDWKSEYLKGAPAKGSLLDLVKGGVGTALAPIGAGMGWLKNRKQNKMEDRLDALKSNISTPNNNYDIDSEFPMQDIDPIVDPPMERFNNWKQAPLMQGADNQLNDGMLYEENDFDIDNPYFDTMPYPNQGDSILPWKKSDESIQKGQDYGQMLKQKAMMQSFDNLPNTPFRRPKGFGDGGNVGGVVNDMVSNRVGRGGGKKKDEEEVLFDMNKFRSGYMGGGKVEDRYLHGGKLPGNKNGDRGNYMLEDGEFVMNKNAVKGVENTFGKGFLKYLNDMFPRKGYDQGGAVGRNIHGDSADWEREDRARANLVRNQINKIDSVYDDYQDKIIKYDDAVKATEQHNRDARSWFGPGGWVDTFVDLPFFRGEGKLVKEMPEMPTPPKLSSFISNPEPGVQSLYGNLMGPYSRKPTGYLEKLRQINTGSLSNEQLIEALNRQNVENPYQKLREGLGVYE